MPNSLEQLCVNEPMLQLQLEAVKESETLIAMLTFHGIPQWREVKVAILARLGRRLTRTGRDICRLHQRRLVAVEGDIDALQPRLWLEALRCRSANYKTDCLDQ